MKCCSATFAYFHYTDSKHQLAKLRPFKKGGGEKKNKLGKKRETVIWSKSNTTQREPKAIKNVRLLDIRSRRRNLMGTDEQKASREDWTRERFNVIIGDAHLSGNGVIMSNQ